jgi:gas vesicle protein
MPSYCENCGNEYKEQKAAQLCKNTHEHLEQIRKLEAIVSNQKGIIALKSEALNMLQERFDELDVFVGAEKERGEFKSIFEMRKELTAIREDNRILRETIKMIEALTEEAKNLTTLISGEAKEEIGRLNSEIGKLKETLYNQMDELHKARNTFAKLDNYIRKSGWRFENSKELSDVLGGALQLLKDNGGY